MATVAGWTALLVVGALAALVASRHELLVDMQESERDAVLAAPHEVLATEGRTELIVSSIDRPFACAVPGRSRAIVVSAGLQRLLSPAQLGAVIEHERAHLVGRHALAVRLADLNAACLPGLRAPRELRRTTRLLLELIADDHAARRAGAAHLANALVRIAEVETNPAAELRAARLEGRRWRPARAASRSSVLRAAVGAR
ncbi:M48 family metalloprotease [Homoserinibacter sp. GY 40078]|nr:M48 family metalloprotease [Homoserinibacter sp. GY 40078]